MASKELIKVNKRIRHDSIPKVLVTSGIYKYSRNPAYLGIILMLVGLLLMYPSLAMAIIKLSFSIGLYFQMEKDEQVLNKRFGKAYMTYKKSVPRRI
jgi:protein-S-isoprenylcysteine O-methyltransferase Ste14